MTTTWYVQSRGYRSQHGYRWIQVDDARPVASSEVLLDGCGGYSVNDLVDEDDRTLLLFARPAATGEPLWTLLANGLTGGSTRGDHAQRPIRVCVLAYARGPLPSHTMLGFARAFLTDTLPTPLPVDYTTTDWPGFTVATAAWTDMLGSLPDDVAPALDPPAPRTVTSAPHTPEDRRGAAAILRLLDDTPTRPVYRPANLTGLDARPLLVVSTHATHEHRDRLRPYLFLSPSVSVRKTVPMSGLRGSVIMQKAKDPRYVAGILAFGAAAYGVVDVMSK
ncbi:hypothetical protein BFF78_35100 [Streptomyces fodineus]|uniref:Uncharacterized protein n=1 Tax=Streptomyces fodineus TaxID=1904616 RepID=A0A1D7YJ33_9ACTN|nr:hypothetical protein [Streptomyces fodineus]AOR35608.1 hypothetical protein BFF78_35100 [Streptomyces fodineus]